jgi:hypothetical protein
LAIFRLCPVVGKVINSKPAAIQAKLLAMHEMWKTESNSAIFKFFLCAIKPSVKLHFIAINKFKNLYESIEKLYLRLNRFGP